MSEMIFGPSRWEITDLLLRLPYSWLAIPDSKDRTCRALTLHLPRTRKNADGEQLSTTGAKNKELLYTSKLKGQRISRLPSRSVATAGRHNATGLQTTRCIMIRTSDLMDTQQNLVFRYLKLTNGLLHYWKLTMDFRKLKMTNRLPREEYVLLEDLIV